MFLCIIHNLISQCWLIGKTLRGHIHFAFSINIYYAIYIMPRALASCLWLLACTCSCIPFSVLLELESCKWYFPADFWLSYVTGKPWPESRWQKRCYFNFCCSRSILVIVKEFRKFSVAGVMHEWGEMVVRFIKQYSRDQIMYAGPWKYWCCL